MKKMTVFACIYFFSTPLFSFSGAGGWFDAVYGCSTDGRDRKYREEVFSILDIHRRPDMLLSDPILVHIGKEGQVLIWRALGSEEFTNMKKIRTDRILVRPEQELWLDVIRKDEEKLEAILETRVIDNFFGDSNYYKKMIYLPIQVLELAIPYCLHRMP